jgi:glycosyltransferase involved in cell wall biosynthesis
LPIHYRALARGLADRGHEVSVLFADRFGSRPQIPDHTGISFIPIIFKFPTILHLRVLGRFLNALGLTEQIRFHYDSKMIARSLGDLESKTPFNIIESPNNGASLHQYLDRTNSHKCIIRIATTDKEHSLINLTEPSPYLKKLFKEEGNSFRNCPNLVTHTNAHRDLICREYGLPEAKFSIIPLSVRIPNEDEIVPTVKKKRAAILFVGRFEKRKGIDILLEAIPKVLKNHKDIDFRLVGPDKGKKYQKAFEKKHPEFFLQVRFLGEKKGLDLESEYKNCDIFIAPSRYESFGLIYAEAMSFAKPTIGTRVGGIPEVIEDGKSGVLCENENIDSFVRAILELLDNPAFANKLGRAGRKRAIELFDMKNLIMKTEDYYLNIQDTLRRN